MEEYTLHELKDLARSLDFELDVVEQQGTHEMFVRDATREAYLLDRLRTLIQQIEDTKLESKFK